MNPAVTGKLEGMGRRPGKRLPQGAGPGSIPIKSAILNTKNEPVVGRNIHHRAGPWLGAELTPWLWTGGTKEVRTRKTVILVDTGGTLP